VLAGRERNPHDRVVAELHLRIDASGQSV
jgi:hypothetical protein